MTRLILTAVLALGGCNTLPEQQRSKCRNQCWSRGYDLQSTYTDGTCVCNTHTVVIRPREVNR